MKKLFIIILIIAFVSLVFYIYKDEIISKFKILLNNLKEAILDFVSKIWEAIKKEFDKRVKIIQKELEKIMLRVINFLIEQFKKGILYFSNKIGEFFRNIIQNIFKKFEESMTS